MSRTAPEVNRYIAAQPPAARAALTMVRQAIGKALPDGEEVISYQIPAVRVDGRVAIFFAGWKAHVAVYPATAALVSRFADELAGYQVSKGTIRFPLDKAIPARMIQRIAAFRGQETRVAAEEKRLRKAAPGKTAAAAKTATPGKTGTPARKAAPRKEGTVSRKARTTPARKGAAAARTRTAAGGSRRTK